MSNEPCGAGPLEQRVRLADDIAAAILCARNAAAGRNFRTVENTDYAPPLNLAERQSEFMECRAILLRVAVEIGIPEAEILARGA